MEWDPLVLHLALQDGFPVVEGALNGTEGNGASRAILSGAKEGRPLSDSDCDRSGGKQVQNTPPSLSGTLYSKASTFIHLLCFALSAVFNYRAALHIH